MESLTVFLPDQTQKQLPAGSTALDLAKTIGSRLAQAAVAAKVNGTLVDLSMPLPQSAKVEIVTPQSPAGLEVIRHSCAHVLAKAIQTCFPGTQITIGPVIENQFYYDVLPPANVKLTVEDFPKIEAEMKAIAAKEIPVQRLVLSRPNAIARFKNLGEDYKVEIIQSIPEAEELKVYTMGEWGDLCRGPHVPTTRHIGAFKLMSISGCYWRGDAKNQQLVRIYGTAWPTQKELDAHLNMLEEAKKRDHVVLGKQLNLFTVFSDIAVGAPTYLPDGAKLFNLLVTFMRSKNQKYGFQELLTPQIMDVSLWKTSGHFDHYKENMYFVESDERTYAVKPMNCPGHTLVFGQGIKSYRDLPLRYSEFGVVHRHELHGAVRGLTRVRRFTQDDAHCFVAPWQVKDELKHLIGLVKEVYQDLQFADGMMVYLSTRPESRTGSDDLWDTAEKALEDVLKDLVLDYQINAGDGAFYGPKIDFLVRDSIGRFHQTATIQLDFQMPMRFGVKYIEKDGTEQTPVMIHRAVLGSVDRFVGLYIEHWAGHFPLGLSPVQVRVIPISESHVASCQEILGQLRAFGIRAEIDPTNEKLNYKIRQAQVMKRPYMLVVGDKEIETKSYSLRFRDGTSLPAMSLEAFMNHIRLESQPFWGLEFLQS